ncbi:MAG TPA: hypothetical protein PL183_11800, partial [Aquamicrobium sp.]|nr:hypothetical protein [Aquamicrobium sp.]
MARKATTTGNLDSEVARELEEALDIDLFTTDDPADLDVAGAIADFEAQISKAAEDLARDSAETGPAAAAPKPAESKPAAPKPETKAAPSKPAEAKPAAPKSTAKPAPQPAANDLRPIEPPAAAPFTHANDDRQRDYRALQQQMRRASPGTIYWVVSLLSLVWIVGGAVVGSLLFQPPLWEVRSL